MSFLYRIVLFALIIFCQCQLIAQDNYILKSTSDNYQRFKVQFDKEFQVSESVTEKDSDENTGKNVFKKTDLPDWFFAQDNTIENQVLALGISDPLMSEKEAKELAYLRAKAILALSFGIEVSGVSDLYLTAKAMANEESKYALYQDFFTFQSRNTYNDSLFKVEEYFYNSNGEALILLSYPIGEIETVSDTSQLVIYADLYEAFKEGKLYNPHNTIRFELLVGSRKTKIETSEYFTYLLKKRNKSIDVETNYNGVKHTFEPISLYYHSNTVADSSDVSGQLLNKGLWNAYVISLFKTMGSKMEGYADIQKMKDYTRESNHEIIRIKKTNQIKLYLKSKNIHQNRLYLDLDIFYDERE